MPNGGSDNCGTCPFNTRNKGEAGYKHLHDPEPAICEIRGFKISNALYTYCANHPKKNPGRIRVPLGPVFRDESRWIWMRSPDTAEIREALLEVLADTAEGPRLDYPAGWSLAQVAMWQLAEFGEARAIPLLERIAASSTEHALPEPFGSHVKRLPSAAKAALAKIRGEI